MVCLTTEIFPRSRSSKAKRNPNSVIKSLLPFVLELTNWQSQWDPPYWIIFQVPQGKVAHFFKKLNFRKELSLLLDKLETKSFFCQKSYSLRQKYLLNTQSHMNSLLVLILKFHFWTDISIVKTTVHTCAPMKSFKTFFYTQNTVPFHFHPILSMS